MYFGLPRSQNFWNLTRLHFVLPRNETFGICQQKPLKLTTPTVKNSSPQSQFIRSFNHFITITQVTVEERILFLSSVTDVHSTNSLQHYSSNKYFYLIEVDFVIHWIPSHVEHTYLPTVGFHFFSTVVVNFGRGCSCAAPTALSTLNSSLKSWLDLNKGW
jgi:hypothetical protein